MWKTKAECLLYTISAISSFSDKNLIFFQVECGEVIDVLELILKQVVLRRAVSYFRFFAIETYISISILAKLKIGKNRSTYIFF